MILNTLSDRLSVSTSLSPPVGVTDLATTTPDAVTAGQAAWDRIKRASKMMREDWRAVGVALLVGRNLHPSNIAFSRWCKENGFGNMHRNVRGDAMWLADNWDCVAQSLCNGDSHPTNIRAAYNAALAGNTDEDDEDEDTAEPATLAAPPHPASLPNPAAAPPPAPPKPEEPQTAGPPPWEDDDNPATGPSQEPESNDTDSPEPEMEEEDSVTGTRTRLKAEDVIKDPDQKAKQELTLALIHVAGGPDHNGTTVNHFMSNYMKEFNASAIFNTIKSDMMKDLHNGVSIEKAKENATEAMKKFCVQMVTHVNTACAQGLVLFAQRTEAMSKAEKEIQKAFHHSTPVHEALNAANAALRKMRK